MKSYEEFAQIYDDLMEDVNYKNWFDYIEEVFKKYNKKPKDVLEMACGTGNFTKYLCEKGYMITCFDISENMLSIAHEKLRRYRNLSILKQDIVSFKLKQNFDGILSICDGMNYITDYSDLERSFLNVYNHLNEEGIFIFDISSYYKLSQILGNNTFVEDNDDVFYVWENSFNETTSICELFLTFFVREGDKYTRFEEGHTQRAYMEDEVMSALRKAGFSKVFAYDNLSFNSPHRGSERINFVALK